MSPQKPSTRQAIIYLRLSDFRDEDAGTFDAREAELRTLAATLGLTVVRVAVENDLTGTGTRGASAYKTPRRVITSTGLVEFRTRRPVFQGVVLDLQRGAAQVLIVGDDSRITRNWRDGLDLLDACRVSGASCVCPDDDGDPRWILTDGARKRAEVSAFLDRVNDARRYSDEIAAKVAKGRTRWAGKSYQGGLRPYGYRVDTTTAQHARNLITDPDEAEVIRRAAADVLKGVSLAAILRGFREDGVTTVTGVKWSARTLRDVLTGPTVVGKTTHRGRIIPAVWEPILDEPTWTKLREVFADPTRRTNAKNANEPKWLVSSFATCGVCGHVLHVTGGKRGPGYVGGTGCCHVRRAAPAVDKYIGDLVVARLEQDDAADLLKPLPRAGVDRDRLTADLATVHERRAMMARQLALGNLTEEAVADAAAMLNAQETTIRAQLASTDDLDPLPEFRTDDPARVVWDALPVPRRRAVVQTLIASVVILRTGQGQRRFDDRTVEVTWMPQVETAEVAA